MRHVLTILAVDDLPRAARFYAEALERAPTVVTESYVELELEGGQRIGLYDARRFVLNTAVPAVPAAPPGATSRAELYFHVSDVAAAAERLSRAGATVLSPEAVRPWGDVAAYFADPEGNVVVVARPQGATGAAS